MKTVVFDFDGVVHSYTTPWTKDCVIPDPPVPGIKEALKEISEAGYEIVIVSARGRTPQGYAAIKKWLAEYDLLQYISKVSISKPPAIVYIDDRALYFDGHPETLLDKIKNFKVWYK